MTDTSFDHLPDRTLIRVNELCNRFERHWQTQDHESIESLLELIDAEHRSLLAAELIALELELLTSRGETVIEDEYLRRFPFVDASLIHAAAECETAAGRGPVLFSDDVSESKQIGEYTVLERIGFGGMGMVYKAVHRRMKRVVAIKLLLPEYAHNALRERFGREILAAAKLSHPNIVAAYDAGDFRAPYLVTEFVDAQNLSQVIRESGPLPVSEALDVIIQAAHGLQYIHERGIIHRDIKPANLLLDDSGQLKILDVGLSRLRNEDPSGDNNGVGDLSSSGMVMGTIACMAPEQACNSRDADERSDIYSLGCTLYFLLTGRHCFDGGSSLDRILAHQQQPVPPLKSPYGDVPRDLCGVFRRMVAKRPNDRPASAAALIEELEACRNGGSAEPATQQLPQRDDSAEADQHGTPAPAERPARVAETAVDGLQYEFTQSHRPRRRTRSFTTGPGVIGVFAVALLALPLLWPLQKMLSGRGPDRFGEIEPPPETENTPDEPARAIAPFDGDTAKTIQQAWADKLGVDVVLKDERSGVDFVLIPPGEFTMGSTSKHVSDLQAQFPAEVLSDWQRDLLFSESPSRRITISKPFYLSRTEVTVEQFRRFVDDSGYVTEPERTDSGNGLKDGHWVRQHGDFFNWKQLGEATAWMTEQHPVGNITWSDAAAYCRWCSRDGIVCRLPTEAEWEFACRAGTETNWSWGDHLAAVHEYAAVAFNTPVDSEPFTEPVGQRRPNPFGLYDMHGNLSEYCRDWYAADSYGDGQPATDPPGPSRPDPTAQRRGEYRVHRGGTAMGGVLESRSAARQMNSIDDPSGGGIRLLREVSVLENSAGRR
ncbi:MAG: SUMF1/EgtB/PvdO family nonheme iron enzyme [Planctomycetaceae bacterium]